MKLRKPIADGSRHARRLVAENPDVRDIANLTRREFLKKTLCGTAGGLLAFMGLMDVAAHPAITWASQAPADPKAAETLPRSIGHVARVSADESACASCGLCSLVCAAVHGDTVGPSSSSIWLERRPFECEYISIACQQCDTPECYFACDVEGAFYIDEKTGARVIDSDKCVGCRQCIEACVFDIPRIGWDAERNVAFKCDLCSGRPEGPACVEFCPRQALRLTREAGA